MSNVPIRRAILSVSDKTGIVDFARALRDRGVEILSTGGTARALEDAGLDLVRVEDFTGFPEMLDGRVKTLHPKVHAGILYRRDDPAHVDAMEARGLASIDLVAVDLYPFERTVEKPGVTLAEAVEQIDIGGPTLLRSAAKNHAHVTVASSPEHYDDILRDMERLGGATSPELRRRLAARVFERISAYDRAIGDYLATAPRDAAEAPAPRDAGGGESPALPSRLEVSAPRALELRYGENPHQAGAYYGSGLERFEKLHGKDLSYNNLLDLAAALELTERLGGRGAAVAIIKHSNPCGAAVGGSVASAWKDALACDPSSASGGIIAASLPIDFEAARAMESHFIELLVAPGFSDDALELLRKKKNRILLRTRDADRRPRRGELALRSLLGGFLVQTADVAELRDEDLRVVTRQAPSEEDLRALRFGWEVVRSVKSNAIVFSSGSRTLGIGAGQMSRVDSVRLAALKAADAGIDLAGAAVASDAFFPFADGLLAAADAGARAVIQPGGSVRDEEVIRAADERGIAMVFTGRRHFRH